MLRSVPANLPWVKTVMVWIDVVVSVSMILISKFVGGFDRFGLVWLVWFGCLGGRVGGTVVDLVGLGCLSWKVDC